MTLKGKILNVLSRVTEKGEHMLSVGDKSPEFALEDQSGKTVILKDFRGKKVVLYFYPRDDTLGCTIEGCEFRDLHDKIVRKDAVLFGISADDVRSHNKFAKKFKFPFQLLADPDHSVCEKYGVWQEKQFMGKKFMGIVRTTFVIDGKGKIAKVYEKVKPEGHARQILDEL